MATISNINKGLLVVATTVSFLSASARERQGLVFKNTQSQKVLAGCTAAKEVAELQINNVRTFIFSGSDMWWDLFGQGNSRYAVPKGNDWTTTPSSNFAGNVWFGGIDAQNQLKIAAQTYRQNGIDFWTGPLSTVDATTTQDQCYKYDKIFKLGKEEVEKFALPGSDGYGVVTENIKNWPGNGDISLNQDPQLAPYVDMDGDGVYAPETGDYPYYDIYGTGPLSGTDALGNCKAKVFGDETLWWVYNDNGNIHQATGGLAIGMEVRAQAFAFKTTDDINNMTFYNYQIINRSNTTLNQTYMTVWTDADLGYYGDDYIGCDVKRGLGYIYNGDSNDESVSGTPGYGAYIPALGCDFFQGPLADPGNTLDDDFDGLTDEPGEKMGMTKFLYFNNSFPGVPLQQTDPDNATEYYNYMTGFWKDGTPFTCGGNAYGGSIQTNYVFPGDPNGTVSSDPANLCGNWFETATPNDRRFMQSAGPFTLLPGAVNYVTFGLPWARTTSSGAPKASIPLLKIADDKAQALFDNCFQVLSGPEAPDMTIQELNNELIIYLTNKPSSNNYLNQYKEKDPSIQVDTTHYYPVDKFYRLEGYKIYQLKNESVTQEELGDESKAKLAFQCDIANGITRIINFEYDATTQSDLPKLKVEGTDKGLQSTFRFTKDLFSSASDQKVVNHKTYYFYCVAYGYNQYGEYKEDSPWTALNVASSEGQKKPYLEGRKSKKAYGIPHDPSSEKDGTIANSGYGYGPKITRHEGQGNGGNDLVLTQKSIEDIVNSGSRVDKITYEAGKGPFGVKIVDPLNVPNTEFALKFINRNWFNNKDTVNSDPCRSSVYHQQFAYRGLDSTDISAGVLNSDTTTWVLTDLSSNKNYYPCKSIKVGEEYYFSDLGLSINIGQANDPAGINFPNDLTKDKIVQAGDIIRGSMTFENSSTSWLTGLVDEEDNSAKNWIRSGQYSGDAGAGDYQTNNDINSSTGSVVFSDPNEYFEGVLGGTWAPYALTAATKPAAGTVPAVLAAPAYINLTNGNDVVHPINDLRALASVDIVLTKDKNKWTRALVLEQSDEPGINPTGARKMEPRRSLSVDKQGVPLGAPGCVTTEALIDTFNYGLGWFPGYAINVETGERLNIAFGEDSYQANNNGNDMMWNPTNKVSDGTYDYAFGGRHYIYVFGNNRGATTYTASFALPAAFNGKPIGAGNYSNFVNLVHTYKYFFQAANGATSALKNSGNIGLMNIFADAMWVNIPLTSDAKYNFTNPANMPCDAKVSLRVKKAYRASNAANAFVNRFTVTQCGYFNATTVLNTNAYYCPVVSPCYLTTASTNNSVTAIMTQSRDRVTGTVNNNNFGYYTFNTSEAFTQLGNADKAKSALDLINVVPNPYYAYSTYESSRIDNRIRITNLPNKCKIRIYTLNGTLVRTFDRDVSGQEDVLLKNDADFNYMKRLPYQDWDLKNQNGITVASGLYIIHVDVPGVGEKILKWFGVMRPLDLQNY